MAILFTASPGQVYIPPGYARAGPSLGPSADRLRLAMEANSDARGQRTLLLLTPRSACGGSLQAIELQRCWTSNVVEME